MKKRRKENLQLALMFTKCMSKTKRLQEFANNKNSCYMHLEKYNYSQKEFTQNEMITKIKKIIEEETNKYEN